VQEWVRVRAGGEGRVAERNRNANSGGGSLQLFLNSLGSAGAAGSHIACKDGRPVPVTSAGSKPHKIARVTSHPATAQAN
jgi:hypothetical protein